MTADISYHFKTFSASDKKPEPVILSNNLSNMTISSLSSKAPWATILHYSGVSQDSPHLYELIF